MYVYTLHFSPIIIGVKHETLNLAIISSYTVFFRLKLQRKEVSLVDGVKGRGCGSPQPSRFGLTMNTVKK